MRDHRTDRRALERDGVAPALRLAVAQVEVSGALPTAEILRSAGRRIRAQMRRAAEGGAHIVQFPEGTLSYPNKRLISASSPSLGEADWSRVDWEALHAELESIGRESRRLGIWTVVGAPHRLSGTSRPHNSLFVFSDRGVLVTRYDKRRLSTTETTYMYTPGTEAVVADVNGIRIGFALCLEILFPEIFVDYIGMGADAVLVSSAPSPAFGLLTEAHAVMNSAVVSLAVAASPETERSPSGVCTPDGWITRCKTGGPDLVTATIPKRAGPSFHQQARAGLYDGRDASDDPRSLERTAL